MAEGLRVSLPAGRQVSDQLKRALTSIVNNIAEGNARRSMAERRRFFDIARASAAEVGSCVDLAKAFGIMTMEKFHYYKAKVHRISKMVWGMIK